MTWPLIAIAVPVCAAPVFAQPFASQSGATPSFSPVTWERLENAADEPENAKTPARTARWWRTPSRLCPA